MKFTPKTSNFSIRKWFVETFEIIFYLHSSNFTVFFYIYIFKGVLLIPVRFLLDSAHFSQLFYQFLKNSNRISHVFSSAQWMHWSIQRIDVQPFENKFTFKW